WVGVVDDVDTFVQLVQEDVVAVEIDFTW
ncbi:MAG: hypothetical protein H6Q26_3463, partial [Bacteroidetes bacterium]|nr:hypothetical protein [Bacteroidota bacterium]